MVKKRKNFMNVILIMVSSINGKITDGANPDVTTWTSTEDQALFTRMKQKFPVIVMGRGTYEVNSEHIHLSKNILRIVLTKNSKKFKSVSVPGSLEFSSETPKALIKRLTTQGYKNVLLVGGGHANSSFFKEGLINELHLTIEPIVFGTGKNLLSDMPISKHMILKRIKKLNQAGTLHLVYKVI
jgi:dihydrofolate reductase